MQQRPGELPAEGTGFVGRRRELDMLAQLLRSARLVTVTGPPGVGKTRLALRAAANAVSGDAPADGAKGRFPGGVCLAELGGLRDVDLLPHTVAASLGLPEHDARPGVDALVDYLCGRKLLLVLDTCEHMIGGCEPLIRAVLDEAPGVTVLATSRQPLDLPGEHVFPVPPLPVPDLGAPAGPAAGTGATDGGDAVELFAQRAAAAAPGFAVTADNRDDVIRLCQRLDGIPLAIELAAVQLRSTPLRALAGSLEHRFLSLAGGRTALPHQQTLRAATQWSYDLCSPEEQLLWARLSVFAGTFSIPLAEDVCAGEPLGQADVLPALIGLVDKSVVLRAEDDDARYRLLDTIREFGAERLAESGAQATVRDRHIAYFLRKAADFSRHSKDDDQLSRFRELRGEHPNIRAALGYALAPPGTPDRDRLAARLAADLRSYWEIAGLLREGRHWLTRILLKFKDPSTQRCAALLTRGVLATFQGELPEATADLEASVAIARDQGDDVACALGHAYLCLALVFSGRHAEAARAGAVAERRLTELGHFSGLVSLDIHLGYMHLLGGEPDLAIERCAQGLRRLGASGERWARGYLQVISATALFFKGNTTESETAAREALRMKHELGDIVGTAYCLEALALLASGQGRHERTAWLLGAADALWERTGKRLGGNAIIESLHQQAEAAARNALGDKRYEKFFAAVADRELDTAIGLAVAGTDESVPAPRRGTPGPLTRREREVAGLVSEGLTNSQIARQLVISSRTVDSHVTNIYTKLGISSRVQLAAWLSSPDGALVLFRDGDRRRRAGRAAQHAW
ncbi:MAG TPA: LuxR C-terminal-related transcriptional regulator [Trebonia sp.]|jgi:non-specific serine/threonine protein kinase|nr:LuxR C-terminal-related transcriptional regulator [Trebonia sp.]